MALDPKRRLIRDLALLLLVSGLAFFVFLGRQPIVRKQEVRVLETAREMAESGDLILPRFCGQVRLEKPPLGYWLALGGFLLWGEPHEAGGRLYSALAGALTVLLVYAFGRSLGKPQLGLWGGLILATSSLFYRASRRAETDGLLTCAITAACYAFFRALDAPSTERRWIRLWPTLAWGAMAVAFLSKGPAGVLFPLISIAIYLAVVRRWRWFGLLFHPPGMALFLLVTAPWFIEVAQRQGNAWQVFLREMTTAATGAKHAEKNLLHDLFYYLTVVWHNFAPWCLLLLPGVPAAVRRARERGVGFILTWAGGILLQLELVGNKQEHYLVPALPPLALIAGLWIVEEAPGLRPLSGPWFPRIRAALLAATLIVLVVWSWEPAGRFGKKRTAWQFSQAIRPIVGEAPAYFYGSVSEISISLLDFYLRRVVSSINGSEGVAKLLAHNRLFFLITSGPLDLSLFEEVGSSGLSLQLVHAVSLPEVPLHFYRAAPGSAGGSK